MKYPRIPKLAAHEKENILLGVTTAAIFAAAVALVGHIIEQTSPHSSHTTFWVVAGVICTVFAIGFIGGPVWGILEKRRNFYGTL